jgi:hypothetical protein
MRHEITRHGDASPIELAAEMHRVGEVCIALFQAAHAITENVGDIERAIVNAEALVACGLELTARRIDKTLAAATADDIAPELAKLTAAFPNAARLDLAPFSVILAEDLLEAAPSALGLWLACRKLRRTSRFLPSISELLECIEEIDGQFRAAQRWIRDIPALIEQARRQLAYQHARRARPARAS